MLTFYYHPLSPIARRVWLALLEKEIPFQPVLVDLKGDQLQPDFLALNPFHHVPVITDGDLRLIESLAILDYLEMKYPTPSLLPQSPAERAIMRMIQMVTVNELMPKVLKLINAADQSLSKQDSKHLDTTLTFLNQQLSNHTYFGGDSLTLADIVVGATVPLFCRLGLDLAPYTALNRWRHQITTRPAWIATNPNQTDFDQWQHWIRRWIQVKLKRQDRNRRQQSDQAEPLRSASFSRQG